MRTTHHTICVLAGLLFLFTFDVLTAAESDWAQQLSSNRVTWLGLCRGHGVAVAGNEIIVFDPETGTPTDTLQGPNAHILGALVRYDLDRYYMVVKAGADIPGELRVHRLSTGLLDTTVALRYPHSHESGFGPFVVSDDGRYVAVLASGLQPSEDPRSNNTYGSNTFVWDVDADSMKSATYSSTSSSVRFLRSKPWVRIDKFAAYDLEADTLVRFKRALGVLSHDGRYHRTGTGLRIGATTDPNDDDLFKPHDANLIPYNVQSADWVVGNHIMLCIPDSKRVKTDTMVKIIDISRDDTLLVCEAQGTRVSVLGGLSDSVTVLGYCDDGTVRKWRVTNMDMLPGVRLIVNSSSTSIHQYHPIEMLVNVYPADTSVSVIVDWGDGKIDPSILHSYDKPGLYTASVVALKNDSPVDTVSVQVSVEEYETATIDGAQWTIAVPGSGVRELRNDPRTNRLLALVGGSMSADYVKMVDPASGSSITTLPVDGIGKAIYVAGDTAIYLFTSKSESEYVGSYDSWHETKHLMVEAHYGLRRPQQVATLSSVRWSENRGNGPEVNYTYGQPLNSSHFLFCIWEQRSGISESAATYLAHVSNEGIWSGVKFENGMNPGRVISSCSNNTGDSLYLCTYNLGFYPGYGFNSTPSVQLFNPETRERIDSLSSIKGGSLSWLGHHHLLCDRYVVDVKVDRVVDTLPEHSIRVILPRGYAVIGTDTSLTLIDVFTQDTLWSTFLPAAPKALAFDEDRSQLYVFYGRELLSALYIDPELYATESVPSVNSGTSGEQTEQQQTSQERQTRYVYDPSSGTLSFAGPDGFDEEHGSVIGSDVLGNQVPLRAQYNTATKLVEVITASPLLRRSLYLFSAVSPKGITTAKVWIND